MVMGRKILLKCYGDVCLKYRLKENWLLSCRSRFCFQKGVAANEFTTQLADSTKFVKVGTVWLSSFRSPKEHNVWDFPTVSTMQQPCCSDAQGICIRTWFQDSFPFMAPKFWGYHQECRRELRHTQMVYGISYSSYEISKERKYYSEG